MRRKKAFFVCGSGGSGKTTFVKERLSDYHNVNVDSVYEELLLKNGLGLKIRDFNEEQKKVAAVLFEDAKQITTEILFTGVKEEKNIVIDTIGRDSNLILNQRIFLENNGYTTFMVMLYSSLETCIERVEQRERVYGQNLTVDSWYLSYGNITTYKREFNDRFVLIFTENNDTLNNKIDDFIMGITPNKNEKNKYL